jgi:hypothetical protein
MNRLVLLLVCLSALLGGCASVPMASLDEDTHAKNFSVRPEKSGIYLYRNESMGGAIPMTVALDGKVAGQTGPQTYFMWEVDPGPHEIASHAENVVTLKLDTDPGKSYFVWQEVKMGLWMARSALHQVEEEAGRKGVAECKRAQSNF